MTKKCCLVLVLMLFFLQGIAVNAVPQDVPKKAVKHVTKANKKLEAQKFEDALELFDKAIKLAPTYDLAYVGKGNVYLKQNNKIEAEKAFQLAIEKAPNSVEAKKALMNFCYTEGKAAYQAKQFAKSNDLFKKILTIPGIQNVPDNQLTKVYFNMGWNYAGLKNLAESNSYFEKFLSQPDISGFPQDVRIKITYQLGINYYQMKKGPESVQYFLKLLEFPELQTSFPQFYSTAHYMVGLNSYLSGDIKKSGEYLKKYLSIGDTSPQAKQLTPLANFFAGAGQLELLKKEVARITGDKAIKDPVKETAEVAKKYAEIETFLKKAIELKPNLEPAYMNLGNYYYYCNEVPLAVATYNTLIQKFPKSPDLNGYKEFLEKIQNPKKDKNGKKK